MLVFIHTPKTGGSTLRRIVRRQCRPRSGYVGLNYLDRPQECLERLAAIVSAPPPGIQAAAGHVPFDVVSARLPQARYVTLVRDPVERVLSAYYYGRHRRHSDAPLVQYVREGVTPANLQTRMLSGRPVSEKPTHETLEAATANLRERFCAVGTTERFDELLTLLRLDLGWTNVLYTRVRETGSRPHREELEPGEREVVACVNRLDVELYARAQGLMEEAIAAAGTEFGQELDALRRANEQFRRQLAGGGGGGGRTAGDPVPEAVTVRMARLLEESAPELDRERARLRKRQEQAAGSG